MAASHKSPALSAKLSTVSTYKEPTSGWSPALPNGWTRRSAVDGAMKFAINAPDWGYSGEATLSVTSARSTGEAFVPARIRRKMLGGVPHTELRRTVIDKMVAGDGWVVNDVQREIAGRQMYIVFAQTPASSDGRTPRQSWVFYFTEADGRIYSLATNSALEFADRIANESAQLMASFPANRSMPAETSLR